jgi:hypothetical protein
MMVMFAWLSFTFGPWLLFPTGDWLGAAIAAWLMPDEEEDE